MADFDENRFSSSTVEWPTPPSLYEAINKEYNFTLDPCCTDENAKCDKHYTIRENGLIQDWGGEVAWVNPPYGSVMVDWLRKCRKEADDNGVTSVVLIPARTNTKWWHSICMKSSEIRFIEGRPKFGNATHGLPFPLALIVFRPGDSDTKLGSFKCPK